MSRKPAKMYRYVKSQAYTRKKYMGGIPNPKITQYNMGDKNAEFPVVLSLKVEERCQIRHNTLEACRVTANRFMSKMAGSLGYHLKVRVFPHIVLRENKQATGAGADRVSQGMRSAFGKNVGTAARVKPNQSVLTIRTTSDHFENAKPALRKGGMKLPSPCKVVVEQME